MVHPDAAYAFRRAIADDATMRLLRSENAPLTAALLDAHLGAPGTVRDTEELHELIDADLEYLREDFELGERSARAYCTDWRNQGFLIRRTVPGSRAETYELSAAAIRAIAFLKELAAPRTTVTESRLVAIANAVHQLSLETDPDAGRRLESLVVERDRIDAEIAKLRAGDVSVLEPNRAVERVVDILLQAQHLPADFARVRSRFEELNRELRVSILHDDDDVLDEVFRGVDLIASSDEGKTFAAFSSLLRDAERSANLDASISAVLARPFAATLTREQRRAFRALVRDLRDGNRTVQRVLTEFASGLRRYVLTQEYRRDRILREELRVALAHASEAAGHIKPYQEVDLAVELPGFTRLSVGALIAHNPADYATAPVIDEAFIECADLELLKTLARETEIDFDELIGHVNATVAEIGAASVGDVLARFPATQGVASVVGLLSLAMSSTQAGAEHEELSWEGRDGVTRCANVPRWTFSDEVRL